MNLLQRKLAFWGVMLCILGTMLSKTTLCSAQPAPTHAINPQVLSLALKAHQKAQGMGVVKKSVMTIIDYSLPSTKPRLWVYDVRTHKVLYHTLVAHGSNTGDNMAKHFSDRHGSLQSSLGVFVTGTTYHGKHGLSLRLHGLEKGFNGNAASRSIVIHSAQYVSPQFASARGRLGRSWGCPALEAHMTKPIISKIKEGSLVFSYYPDKAWLNRSAFVSV